jgi:hypothetical protein
MSSLKWTTAVLAMTLALTASPNAALAERDEYEDSQSHPLRVAAYLVHPVGYALEWAIFRPFHYLVSSPGADKVFGHAPHGCSDYGSGTGCYVRSPAYAEEYLPPPQDYSRAEDAAERAERAAESAKRAAEHGMRK